MLGRIGIAAAAMTLLIGCARIGQASDDEKDQLAAWSRLVTPRDREQVTRAASEHTDWAEKKKVLWMTQQYRARYERSQAKQAATRAAGQAATQAAKGE